MGQRIDSITPDLQHFLESSPMFFVATAPAETSGHVNLSPKGYDSFRVLNPRSVAYLDLTGSGNETAAHVTENRRLTLMFCAFSGRPQVVRLYCDGRVVVRGSNEWAQLFPLFPNLSGVRQIIVGELDYALTSCGYAVPQMTLASERDQLLRWAESKGEEGLIEYRRTRNSVSLDGLPAPPTDALAAHD
jgi:hypothetical protein